MTTLLEAPLRPLLAEGELTPSQRRSYLRRIGIFHTPRADLDALRSLQRAHLLAVPYENFDIHLGRTMGLDVEVNVNKLVEHRRGRLPAWMYVQSDRP